jgi:ABC-type transport system involved in Fe-S cluster assembly fused permease/ATPase subunit
LDDLLWASVAVNAATRIEIVGVSAARKKVITRLIFRVRISCSFSASVRVNSSLLEAVATALIES